MSEVKNEIERELKRFDLVMVAAECVLNAATEEEPTLVENWLVVGDACLKAAEKVQQ